MSGAPLPATQFRDGAWAEGAAAERISTRDPATGRVLAEYRAAGPSDVRAALDSAAGAFPAWRDRTVAARAERLARVAACLEERAEAIAEAMTAEMGKAIAESRAEVGVFVATCRFFAAEAARAFGEVLPSALPDRHIHTRRRPLGPVLCITPWNFPIALAGYKIFAALALGNTVVWKPAHTVTGSALLVTEAFAAAGCGGEFTLIGAATGELGPALIDEPRTAAVAFTGSTGVGIEIAGRCAARLLPNSLELGGKNATIVLADANLPAAAAGVAHAAFVTSGQRCTASSRVIVQREIAEEFLTLLDDRVDAIVTGPGNDPAVSMGPLATAAQLDSVVAAVDAAVAAGAVARRGGQRLRPATAPDGWFYAPTVLTGVAAGDPIEQEELFGPVLAVILVDDLDEAIRVNNGTRYGLSSAIYTRDLRSSHRAMAELDSGLVYVNSGTSAAELGVPFGGTGLSGNGHREVSAHAFDFMTALTAVYVSYGEDLA